MPRTRSSGIDIAYDDMGQGEPALLLMPGWCADRRVFGELAPLCARHRRTLSLDWRGHGESESPTEEFGEAELVEDALSVIAASRVRWVVPVAQSHAGWVALALRRRLGEIVPRIVLTDWLVLDPPAPFLEALQGMQNRTRWRETVDRLLASWMEGVENPELTRFLRERMGSHGFDMWSRAAWAIGNAYARWGNPLQALSRLSPPVPVLHLYGQPEDPGFLEAQQAFAERNSWFHVAKLPARSHFPMYEVPGELASRIVDFTASRSRRAA